jgi:peroxiredoxin
MYEEYGPDGFIPLMVMYDTTPSEAGLYADEKNLGFPILSDPDQEVFGRWDPSITVPSSTILDRGAVVAEVGTTWYQSLIEGYVYGDE